MLDLGEDGGQTLEIGLEQRAVLRLVQGRRRMQHRHDEATLNGARLTVNTGNLFTWEKERHRKTAQGDNYQRVEGCDLLIEVRLGTGGDFIRQWVAVLRWATLHHIADENVAALQPRQRQKLIEELTRRADERTTLAILVKAGAFTDQHDLRVGWAFARYSVGAPPV